jgi:hypothetical protein
MLLPLQGRVKETGKSLLGRQVISRAIYLGHHARFCEPELVCFILFHKNLTFICGLLRTQIFKEDKRPVIL